MKKLILFLAFLLGSLSLFAQQEPIVKFYLNDGSTKQYNISDIKNISLLTGNSNYIMNIYYQGSQISNFSTNIIESIKFDYDAGNNQILNIYISGKPNSFRLLEIDSINFKISDAPLPQITSINPASGKIGDQITLTGTNFDDNQDSSFVSFNSLKATDYTSWSRSEIKVKVPTGATSGKLSITVNNQKSNEVDFQILAPNQPQIININPKAANIGDVVTIDGMNFRDTQGSGFVSFNGINASEYTSWTDTEIKVNVPIGTKSGKVSVTANSIKSNDIYFTILPLITSLKPTSGNIGDVININGKNFRDTKDAGFVSFDSIEATEYISWNDTLIKVKVPEGIESGKISVTVESYISNEVDFNIIPQITSIEPAAAIIGDIISITGISFGVTQGTDSVFFNSIKAIDYINWSDTEIKVKVPPGAATGKITVMVKGVRSNEMDFAVIPNIESINPSSERTGNEIKIKGTGFDKKTGESKVSFQGMETQNVTSWISTEIILNVPVGAETGKVSVTVGSQKSNELDFTVLPSITYISPSKFKIGDEITINGFCFGEEQSTSTISFNGTYASEVISWSSTQIIVKVPTGATSGKLSVTVDGNKSNEFDYKIVSVYIESIDPCSAYEGDEVTISGFGYGTIRGSSIVSFTGKDASEFTSWSDTEIKVKVPNGAKTGKVSVSTRGEKSNEVDFTVNTTPATYEEVTIGTQVWMLKNLDVTTYRNGDEIPQVTDQTEWANLTTGAWCYYNNDPANGEIYGKMYNWYAVNDSRGLAPSGWHIPTDGEWTTLRDYLGGKYVAGGKMKETGTTHWNSPNTGATNESGFTGLPGGLRNKNNYYEVGIFGTWWSSTEYNATAAWSTDLHNSSATFPSLYCGKEDGYSIRCVKD